jgi:hypothetical protein
MNTAFPTRTPNGPSPLLPTGMCHDLIQKGLKTYVLTFIFIEVSTQVFGRVWNKAGFLAGGPARLAHDSCLVVCNAHSTEHLPHITHTTQCACMSTNEPTKTPCGKRRRPKMQPGMQRNFERHLMRCAPRPCTPVNCCWRRAPF